MPYGSARARMTILLGPGFISTKAQQHLTGRPPFPKISSTFPELTDGHGKSEPA